MNAKRWSMMSLCAVCLALVLVATGGCSKKNKDLAIDTGLGSDSSGAGTGSGSGDGLPGIDQENLIFEKLNNFGIVYFDYDSSVLRPDALAVLKEDADLIKQLPANTIIQIEGHCDERGTQEYNLALGERRALSVREYLMKLGISGDRMLTITYGEECPAVMGSNEAAWAKNRRCQFNRAK